MSSKLRGRAYESFYATVGGPLGGPKLDRKRVTPGPGDTGTGPDVWHSVAAIFDGIAHVSNPQRNISSSSFAGATIWFLPTNKTYIREVLRTIGMDRRKCLQVTDAPATSVVDLVGGRVHLIDDVQFTFANACWCWLDYATIHCIELNVWSWDHKPGCAVLWTFDLTPCGQTCDARHILALICPFLQL